MAENGELLIRLQDVSLTYLLRSGVFRWSRFTPITNITLDLHRGETLGVIGRNGVGKSSLLRVIAGLVEPDVGTVTNFGARVSLLALGIGFVEYLSGRQNAIMSGMLMGLRKKSILQKIPAIQEFSGLGIFFDQPINTYSTGMRARLGFSVAIQVDPDVLLIDEVMGVGDEEFKTKSSEKMKELIRSDKTVVLVSHSMQLMRELCDRIIWIEDGGIHMIGEKNEVIDRYLAVRK